MTKISDKKEVGGTHDFLKSKMAAIRDIEGFNIARHRCRGMKTKSFKMMEASRKTMQRMPLPPSWKNDGPVHTYSASVLPKCEPFLVK